MQVQALPSDHPQRWERIGVINRLVIGALCATLAGCGDASKEDALDTCKRQVEPTVLLRQLALPSQKKAEVERCLADSNLQSEFCRAVYLDEDQVVRSCMSGKGYSFAPIHSLIDHIKADCYRPTWLVKIESLVQTPANPLSPSAPAIGPCQF
jgi:hypothetical protein